MQPWHNTCMQHCIKVKVLISGLPVCVLLDGGSKTNMILPEFTTMVKAPAIKLQEQMTLQLTVTGLCSKINYGTWVPIKFRLVEAKVYFDIANIKGYNVILGTLFLWEFGVSPFYSDDGWIMREKHIHLPSQVTPTPFAACTHTCRPPCNLAPLLSAITAHMYLHTHAHLHTCTHTLLHLHMTLTTLVTLTAHAALAHTHACAWIKFKVN